MDKSIIKNTLRLQMDQGGSGLSPKKEQHLKLNKKRENKTVLASRPGAISMCFPQVALASSNIREERLVIRSEPSAWFGFLIRQKQRQRAAIAGGAKVFRHMSSNVTDNHARP